MEIIKLQQISEILELNTEVIMQRFYLFKELDETTNYKRLKDIYEKADPESELKKYAQVKMEHAGIKHLNSLKDCAEVIKFYIDEEYLNDTLTSEAILRICNTAQTLEHCFFAVTATQPGSNLRMMAEESVNRLGRKLLVVARTIEDVKNIHNYSKSGSRLEFEIFTKLAELI